MKIRSTSIAMAAMVSAGFLAAPINVLAKAPEIPQGMYAQPFAEGEQKTEKEIHYKLKWELKKKSDPNEDSMAKKAITKVTAVEKNGKYTFTFTTKSVEMGSIRATIGKLFYYKNGKQTLADKKGDDWSFTLDEKPNTMTLAFAIDGVPFMADSVNDATLNISDYEITKTVEVPVAPEDPGTTDSSKPNPGETPEQKPKEETPLEKAKKSLDEAVNKANGEDKNGWDVDVAKVLNATASAADTLLRDASAKEEDLTLKVSELNFLLALGQKTKVMEVADKTAYKDFIGAASDLDTLKVADKGDLKAKLDMAEAFLKADGKKADEIKAAGEKLALYVGNLKPADPMDIGNLKALIEQKKKVDPSPYTEKSQKELKDLLETASKEIEGGKLTKGHVRELEAAINGWHGELKAPEKPKEDQKDEKKKNQTIRYNVPVSLVRSDGSRSMAASALSGWARIDQYRDSYTYYLQFQGMDMNGSKGHMTRLFYYENGRKYGARYHGGDLWSFSLNRKTSSQKIAVWVDVMDQIAGGPGKGEQDAYLRFDWGQAREVGRFDGEMRQAEQAAPPVETKAQEQGPEQKLAEKKTLMASQSQKEVDAVLRDFRDVPANHWAMKAIAHAYARGYFKGQGGGQFAPDRSISRGEFVTILGRKAGFVGAKTSNKFKDVPSNAYYAAYVAWAESKGIIQGTSSKTFDPDRTISREEMALILDKFLAKEGRTYPAGNGASFYDQASIAPWAKGSVDKMVKQGILSGTGNGIFSPQAKFSRGQAAQILYVMDLKDKK